MNTAKSLDQLQDEFFSAWPKPQPLTAKIDPIEYPLDGLPEIIREAVNEVSAFVKAPLPLVVNSAIGALSLAAQPYVNVKRAEKLTGPVSLFMLSIADSGERKTSCDSYFSEAIRLYEREQAEAAEPLIKDYEADIASWNAERDSILSAIRNAGKGKGDNKKPVDKLKEELRELERNKPEPPFVPRLLLGDETPESLAYNLAKKWPSSGVVSSEAGVIFGSHGMSSDSMMRNLAQLNVLWDGGDLSIGRKTSESFVVRDARLTVALQVQESTIRSFFDKSGALARGTGFMARFLFAWPESTQGRRLFTEAPSSWPKLAAFNRRMTAILNTSIPLSPQGGLAPSMLTFTPEAKDAWIEFYNAIESQLGNGGELYDIRDVASKIADNAARLAALFHVFSNSMTGEIDYESFDGASRIVAWHLHEARRFFGELALPAELVNAVRLDSWLIDYAKRERTHMINKRHALQYGPLRNDTALTDAIKELEDLDRVRLATEGKRKVIKLNPALY